MNLTENVKKSYEAYIEGDKKKALDMLIPGQDTHYFLTILEALKSEKHKVSKKTTDLIAEFANRYGNYNEDVKKLELRRRLQEFDGADAKGKEETIEYLQNEFVRGQFHHSKPADLKRKEKKVEKQFNEKDHTLQTKETFLGVDKFIEKMLSENRQCELHSFYLNQVDYSKFTTYQF